MEESVFDITLKIQSQKEWIKTTQFNDFAGTFFVKLRGVKTEKIFLNKQLLLTDNDNFLTKNLMTTIIREQSRSCIMLVRKIVISLLLIFLCLVMNVVYLSINNYMINIYKSVNCYHVNIWEVLRVIMAKKTTK